MYNLNLVEMACIAALERIRKHYIRLTNLRINSILDSLFTNGTITHDEKKEIDRETSDKEKMKNFLDKILIPSLKIHLQKYNGFLAALEEADDSDMNLIAKEIGMWLLICSICDPVCQILIIFFKFEILQLSLWTWYELKVFITYVEIYEILLIFTEFL